MKIVIRLTRDDLPRMGSNSIQGKLFTEFLKQATAGEEPSSIKEVEIQYPEVSDHYLQTHLGLPEIILPEYVPFGLMSDLLWLTQEGFQVSLTTYVNDDV